MNLKTLQQGLRPLAASEPEPSPLERAYFREYGIDLENQLAGVRHQFGYFDSCDYRIACHLYLKKQARGSVFILHGYFDHSGYFGHIIRFFLNQNLNVLIYDLPGHGLSTGPHASIPCFSEYTLVLRDLQNYCRDWLPGPWHGYGQSTGAAILTDFLLELSQQKQDLPFEKLVLSAPLVRPRLWHISRIQLHLMKLFVRQISRKYTHNSRDPDFIQKSHNDPLSGKVLPFEWLLALDRWIKRIESTSARIAINPRIIQGTHDGTIDALHNIPVLQRLYQNTDVLWLENARHHLPNEIEVTRQQYFNWLTTYFQ